MIPAHEIRNKKAKHSREIDRSQQVYNFNTQSWVDKKDYSEAMKPDTRNPNIPEEAKN
jgi:hypothetical protein